MGIPAGDVKVPLPNLVTIEGSFGPTMGIDGVPYLNCADHSVAGDFDTIIESAAGAGPVDTDLRVESVADAVATNATMNSASKSGRLVAPAHINTVFALGGTAVSVGTAGNGWEIFLFGIMPAAAGELVFDDLTNRRTFILFEPGVSTAALAEVAVGAYGGELVVSAADTLGGFLTVADDQWDSPAGATGGIDQEWVSDDGAGLVTIHFEDGVSTIAEVEAAITAYAAAGGLIQVQTAGTGVTVLDVADDEWAEEVLLLGSAHDVRGKGFTVLRTAVGTYAVHFVDRYPVAIHGSGCLQLTTAAALVAQPGAYTQATGILVIRVQTPAAVATDMAAATDRVHFSAVFQTSN